MPNFQSIQKIYDAEIELIRKESALLLMNGKEAAGFDGELRTSGLLIENYIKGIIKKHIPSGYRICSGYVTTPSLLLDEEKNLPQHDIIIVDNRIPSIHMFGSGDIELVPAEAVCGIFEIKRKLDKK